MKIDPSPQKISDSERSRKIERRYLALISLKDRSLKICLFCFVTIMLLLPLHAFLSTWGGTAIGPLLVWKSWKEIALALLVPFVAVYCLLEPEVVKLLWSRWFNKLIVVYVALHLVLAFFSQASMSAVVAGLLMNLRFLAMVTLGQLIAASDHPWVHKLKAWLGPWLLWVMIGLSIVAILQVTVLPKDFFAWFGYNKDTTIAPVTLVDNNPNVLRAFATMRGPNTLGAYLLIPLAFGLYCLTQRRRRALATVAALLGILALVLTDSRSAWLGAGAMVLAMGGLFMPRQVFITWAKRLIIPVIVILALLGWAAVNVPALRLAIFHSSPGDPTLTEGSTDAHWAATWQGIKGVIAAPLGTGPGSAGPASFYNTKGGPRLSEDYFVQIGQEAGVLGMLLFLAISFLVAKALWQTKTPAAQLLLASFIGINVINIFLHGWADDPTAMTWWGLAGLVIFENRSDSDSASARRLHTSEPVSSRHAS